MEPIIVIVDPHDEVDSLVVLMGSGFLPTRDLVFHLRVPDF
jgi:hypothetical protein